MCISYIVKTVKNKLLSKKKMRWTTKELHMTVTNMTAKTFTFLFTKNSKLKSLIYENQVALSCEEN